MAAQWVPTGRTAGPGLRLSVPVLVLGIIAVVVAFVGLGEALVHTVSDATVLTSPATEKVECGPGSYVLYVESGSPALPTAPGDVVVTSPAGLDVSLQLQPRGESVNRGGERFSGQVSFDVTVSGAYTVTVRPSGVTLLVAPSFPTIARDNLGWVILLLAGLLSSLTGLVLLIVGVVRRSRARRQAALYGGGPYGGGPAGPWQPPGLPWPVAPPPPGAGDGRPAWPPPPPPGQAGWAERPERSPPPPHDPPQGPAGWPRPSPPAD